MAYLSFRIETKLDPSPTVRIRPPGPDARSDTHG
jgi:hypothetical protein